MFLKKPESVPNCPPILGICSVNQAPKVILEAEHSLIILLTRPSCLVFAMFPYPVINCQGLSNLLGLLAVPLDELETALIYKNKIKIIRLFKWVILIAFGY